LDNLETELDKYEPGKPANKPDVIKQTAELKEKREKMKQDKIKELMTKTGIIVNNEHGQQINLTRDQAKQILNNLNKKSSQLQNEVNMQKGRIQYLEGENASLKKKIELYEKQINELQKNIKW